MPYRWEPREGAAGRYRDTRTGRYASGATVRRELDAYLDNSDTAARSLAEALRGRQVSLADAEIAFRRMIKNTHINSAVMARGGYANMTPRDWGLVGQRVRYNYGKARDMFVQIAEGKQRLDGTLTRRFELYGEAGRNTFYRAKQANLQPGLDMVGSVRHAHDSCKECIYLDGKWFRVGDPEYKLPGQRICLSRCRCSERYGRFTPDGVETVEAA